jgi:hypothetical protein
MKKVFGVLILLMAFSSTVAAEDYYVDVYDCSAAPLTWAMEYLVVPVPIIVWDHYNALGNSSHRSVAVMLGPARADESKHRLSALTQWKGDPGRWHAVISAKSVRVRGYDGLWYLVSWGQAGSYDNSSISNVTALHLNFTWKLDPSH